MQLQILLFLPGAIWPHHPASPAKKKKVSGHIHCSASFVIQALNSSELWPAFVFYQTSIVSRDVQVDLFGMTSGQQGSFILNSVCPFPDAGIICSFVPWVVVALLVKDWNAFNKRVTQKIFFLLYQLFMYIYVYIDIFYWCSLGNKSQWTRIFWDFDAFAYILLQLPPDVCAVDGARELLNHLSD